MTTYKVFKSDFPKLQKRINRITKKLDKYNLEWNFEVIEEKIVEVEIWDYTLQFPVKRGTTPMEVVYYTFDMQELKLGDYSLLAIIEHDVVVNEENTKNIIHVFKEEADIPKEYRTIDSHCEHCNINRQRNKTVLLQDSKGNIKQVGTTCVKEYTGIDRDSIIRTYADIHNIAIEDDLRVDYINFKEQEYMKTVEYLASCIKLIENEGYKKSDEYDNSTKEKGWYKAIEGDIEDRYINKAKEVIEYFSDKEYAGEFMYNIKTYLELEYNKKNGFLAYAYVAYQKELEKDKEKELIKESEYQGTVGDREVFELTYDNVFSFDGYYGTQFIYLFKDNEGNIYKWKTSKALYDIDKNDNLKLKGTIKEHEEYRGNKQTVLTRCKVV